MMVLTLSIFVRQKSLYSKKKERKSASRRLSKLKKRVLKRFVDEILNYRSAGPGPKKVGLAHPCCLHINHFLFRLTLYFP
jgi:hypothetical protein